MLKEQCDTCIFRPGNKMHLNPGRVAQMVRDANREGSQGIICHKTLPFGDNPDMGGALCRGYYDSNGPNNNFIRVMERIGGFEEISLPQE